MAFQRYNATGANYNNLNQVTNQVNNGFVLFSGNIPESGVVSVAGTSAVMTNQTNFSAYAVTTQGTNVVQVSATDLDLNTSNANYQLVVTNASVSRTLSYDANGNLTNSAASTATNSYEWDAADRLTAFVSGTNRSEFTYDGTGRRVKIVEKTNGVVQSTKTFVWCGAELCEERDATGTNVTKRFFPQGEQISGTNYYFTRDHLGSVREMVDSGGTIHARYDYDPYGRITKLSGDMDADFGFTGHYNHSVSGLYLTLFRAYDSDTGRWISRDLIAESGGLNLYTYVANNGIALRDPFGLWSWGGVFMAAVVVAAVGVAVVASGGAAAILAPAIADLVVEGAVLGGITGAVSGATEGWIKDGWEGALDGGLSGGITGFGLGGLLGPFGSGYAAFGGGFFGDIAGQNVESWLRDEPCPKSINLGSAIASGAGGLLVPGVGSLAETSLIKTLGTVGAKAIASETGATILAKTAGQVTAAIPVGGIIYVGDKIGEEKHH